MGEPAVALYMNDATGKVREKLRQLAEHEIKQTASQTESFTSTVSHEMRTPIQTMLFMLGLLLKILQAVPMDPNDIKNAINYCTIITTQTELLSTFVEDLLDLRQLRDGVFKLANAPFDVIKVINDVCSIFSFQAKAKNIEICSAHQSDSRLDPNFEERPPSLVLGDNRRFKQVLMNLMKNAMKFTRSGKIMIKARYEGQPSQMLFVDVIDTGAGIAPEDMAALFSRFGKLLRTAEINSEGIGLGLMIVKQIVESASGQVKVFSEGVGKGSTFTFSMFMPCV